MVAACEFGSWIDYMKQADDTMECVLNWADTPAWVYVIFVLVLFALSWRGFVYRRLQDIAHARASQRNWTAEARHQRRTMAVFGVLLIAAAYAIAWMAPATIALHRSMDDGMPTELAYSRANLESVLEGMQPLTSSIFWAVVVAGAALLLLACGAVARSQELRFAANLLLVPGILVGLGGVWVLIVAMGGLVDGEPLGRAVVMTFWGIGLIALGYAAARVAWAGSELADLLNGRRTRALAMPDLGPVTRGSGGRASIGVRTPSNSESPRRAAAGGASGFRASVGNAGVGGMPIGSERVGGRASVRGGGLGRSNVR